MDPIADWALGKARWYEYRAENLADLVRDAARTIAGLGINGPFAVRLAVRTSEAARRAAFAVDEMAQLAYTLRRAAVQVDPSAEPPPTTPPVPVSIPRLDPPSAGRVVLDLDAMTAASPRLNAICGSFDELATLLLRSLDDAPPGLDPLLVRRIEDGNQLARRRLADHATALRSDAAELRQRALIPYLVEGGFAATLAGASYAAGTGALPALAVSTDPSSPIAMLLIQGPFLQLATALSKLIDDQCSRLPAGSGSGAGFVIGAIGTPVAPYGGAPMGSGAPQAGTPAPAQPPGIGVFPVPDAAGTDFLVQDPATGETSTYVDYRSRSGPCGPVPILVGLVRPQGPGLGRPPRPPRGTTPTPHGPETGPGTSPRPPGKGPEVPSPSTLPPGAAGIAGGGAAGIATGALARGDSNEKEPDDVPATHTSGPGAVGTTGAGSGGTVLDLGPDEHPADLDDVPTGEAGAITPGTVGAATATTVPDPVRDAGRSAREEGPYARYSGGGIRLATPEVAASAGLAAAGATGGAIAVGQVAEARRVTSWSTYQTRHTEREEE
jgi:hypothetical protein